MYDYGYTIYDKTNSIDMADSVATGSVIGVLAGMSSWYILLMCIPMANLVVSVLLNLKIAEKFGKTGGFAVGLILFNVIFMAILAFDNSEYNQA